MAFLYISSANQFLVTQRNRSFALNIMFRKQRIPLNKWFHMVIQIDNVVVEGALLMYVDGVLIEPDHTAAISISELSPDSCTKLYLGMTNTCNTIYQSTKWGGSAAYSHLTVFDGRLTPKQIEDLYESGLSLQD